MCEEYFEGNLKDENVDDTNVEDILEKILRNILRMKMLMKIRRTYTYAHFWIFS